MKAFFILVGCMIFSSITVAGLCWGSPLKTVGSQPCPATLASKKQGNRIPPLKRSTLQPAQPWILQTSIPLYIVGGGGLIVTSIGVIGSLSQPENTSVTGGQSKTLVTAPSPWGILFFGGLSMMSSSVSAGLWRGYPKQWMAVLGSVLTGGIALTGGLMAGLGQDTLTLSLGWGFLASLPIHIILNIVGWFNVKHHQIIREQKEKADDASTSLESPRDFRVHIRPSLFPNGAGIQLVGQF